MPSLEPSCLAMVLAIAIELVVESAQIDFDGKFGIEREHAANMPGGAGLIAKHFRAKRHFSASCIVGYHFDAAEHTSPNPAMLLTWFVSMATLSCGMRKL
jgi:hypothetical protein